MLTLRLPYPAVGALIALALTSMAALVYAAPGQPAVVFGRTADIAAEKAALTEAKAQAAQARARARRMEARAGQVQAEADRLAAQAGALAARVAESQADLVAGQARLAIIDRLIAGQQADLAARQGPLIRLSAALQSLSRRPVALALVRPGSLSDTLHARAALATVLPVIDQRTAALRATLARTRRLHHLAADADAALRTDRDRLATRRTALAQLETKQRALARGLADDASGAAERATVQNERARDIDELLAAVARAGDVRARLAALPDPDPRPDSPTAPPPAASGPPAYRLPVAGTLVTGTGELSNDGVRSRGVTLATAAGAPVTAPAAGRVAWAGPYRGFGQIVIVDHGDGWTSLLADLGRLSVRAGQQVAQGAALGQAQSGPHPAVIVELRRRGRPVDLVALATLR